VTSHGCSFRSRPSKLACSAYHDRNLASMSSIPCKHPTERNHGFTVGMANENLGCQVEFEFRLLANRIPQLKLSKSQHSLNQIAARNLITEELQAKLSRFLGFKFSLTEAHAIY
jgi:hypothetical protein